VVLAITASLRTFVAKGRSDVVQAHRLRQIGHAVLKVRATHGRGVLCTERQLLPAPVLEDVHLLLHEVGASGVLPRKQTIVLEDGRIEPLVSIQSTHLGRALLDVRPVRLLGRKYVDRSS